MDNHMRKDVNLMENSTTYAADSNEAPELNKKLDKYNPIIPLTVIFFVNLGSMFSDMLPDIGFIRSLADHSDWLSMTLSLILLIHYLSKR